MIHHEDAEQAAVFTWASYYPRLRWLHSIPNGGNRNIREAARLKKQGVKPGVADIFLPIPMDPYHGLYIEMKRQKKDGRSVITEDQVDFLMAAKKQGYRCEVCYGAESAIRAIVLYVKM